MAVNELFGQFGCLKRNSEATGYVTEIMSISRTNMGLAAWLQIQPAAHSYFRKVSAVRLTPFCGIDARFLSAGYGVNVGDSLIAVNQSVPFVLQRKTVPRWVGSPGHMTYRAE